jgi:hypothetical protein
MSKHFNMYGTLYSLRRGLFIRVEIENCKIYAFLYKVQPRILKKSFININLLSGPVEC